MEFFMFYFLSFLFGLFLILRNSLNRKHHACYILDYECFKPSDDRKANSGLCYEIARRNRNLGLDECKFLLKLLVSSGIGEETYAPRNFFTGRAQSATLSDAILEMEEFFYHTLDNLFSKSGISPSEIDLLVVNVATFSTLPSLSARIVNHYKLREDIKVFNLSGMGCSGSLISINLVQNIFKTRKNLLAIVVTSEAIAPNWYIGTKKSMLFPSVLFRSGGCAILLTNNPAFQYKAKLKLKYLVRTHLGANDEAYECVMRMEDEQGNQGISLNKNLLKVAGESIIMNFTELAPKIMPIKELLRYVFTSYLQGKATINFKTCINHFIIHTGGKKLIDDLGTNLGLSEYDLEPSRMSLHRFGNTSAASIWYVLSYMEAKKRLKRGEAILMINPGAGFKCNTCVLEVVRDLDEENVWRDCIDRYPPETTVNPFMEKYGWINDVDDPSKFNLLLENESALQDYGAKWTNKNI